jgi:hypothetical protein
METKFETKFETTFETLFETQGPEAAKHCAIVLVDASGSTTIRFNAQTTTATGPQLTINAKMEEIVENLPAQRFRVIFWNSNYPDVTNNRNFPGGVVRMMHVVDKRAVKSLFAHARTLIQGNCYTYPHLGFRSIPDEWIDDTSPTHIYFLTDGQMGPDAPQHNLKHELRTAIEHLFARHNNVHLHLITVESREYDFGSVEALQVAAGGDVFEVIQTHQLTKYITEFKSFTPNYPNGYHHINTIIPPPGYLPFMDRCFSETKVALFIQYLNKLIRHTQNEDPTQREDRLLKIVQSLSATLRVLTKDKPQSLVNNIVTTFCELFKDTAIDTTVVQFILADTIQLEQQGKAMVFAQYRARLKDLYRQAQSFLEQNTKTALGFTQEFITLPINNKLVCGNHLLVNESVQLGKNTFPNSSIKVNKMTLPVVPLLTTTPSSLINEQCLRQFVRSIIGEQYNVESMGDIIIYLVMGLALKVIKSPIADKYKTAYRQLARIMLKKKRLNTDVTELSRIEEGELPIPNNGKIETFYGYMTQVTRLLNITCDGHAPHPMTVWFLLCSVLDNPVVMTKQLIHCAEDLKTDNVHLVQVTPVQVEPVQMTPIQVCEKSLTDYTCIITLMDCAAEGGFLFAPHQSPTGAHCEPIYIISDRGRTLMLEQPNVLCPVCYQNLGRDIFRPIGAKLNDDATIFPDDTMNPFAKTFIPKKAPAPAPAPAQASDAGSSTDPPITGAAPSAASPRGFLVCLQGTVGSGKTTYAAALQHAIEAKGGYCINENTDKYCVAGYSTQDACQMVGQHLQPALTSDKPLKVVIVDTCGDRINISNVFGHNFQGWKMIKVQPNYARDQQKGYLAWSLRNVLLRSAPTKDSNYYLNPVRAGVLVCVNVHRKKAEAVFGCIPTPKYATTVSIEMLNPDADQYSSYLASTLPLTAQVQQVLQQITA